MTAMQFLTAGGTGGHEVMRIDEKGNVGIGTTTPLAPLHVTTSSNFQETNVTQSFFTNASTSTLVHGTGVTQTNVASAIFANAMEALERSVAANHEKSVTSQTVTLGY